MPRYTIKIAREGLEGDYGDAIGTAEMEVDKTLREIAEILKDTNESNLVSISLIKHKEAN